MEDFDLSDFFQTKAQAIDFSTRLAHIIESLYKTDFILERVLMEQFGIQKKDVFLKFLRSQNIATEKIDSLKAIFTKMQETIQTLPILSLTIAFEPNETTLKLVSQWFVAQLHKQLLLDIKVDTGVIGGAAMTYKGRYLDYSIKPVFDKIFKETLSHPQNLNNTNLAGHLSTEHIELGR